METGNGKEVDGGKVESETSQRIPIYIALTFKSCKYIVSWKIIKMDNLLYALSQFPPVSFYCFLVWTFGMLLYHWMIPRCQSLKYIFYRPFHFSREKFTFLGARCLAIGSLWARERELRGSLFSMQTFTSSKCFQLHIHFCPPLGLLWFNFSIEWFFGCGHNCLEA